IKTPSSIDAVIRYTMLSPSPSAQSDFGIHSSGKFFIYGGTSVIQGSLTVQPDTVYVLIATFDGSGNHKLWVNGSVDISGNSGSHAGVTGTRIGDASNGFVGDWTLAADTDTVLSDSEIEDITDE